MFYVFSYLRARLGWSGGRFLFIWAVSLPHVGVPSKRGRSPFFGATELNPLTGWIPGCPVCCLGVDCSRYRWSILTSAVAVSPASSALSNLISSRDNGIICGCLSCLPPSHCAPPASSVAALFSISQLLYFAENVYLLVASLLVSLPLRE